MVYKLRPMEVSFDFDDREYRLGDTIRLSVQLVPSGDVDVREARVDVLCEERFVESYTVSSPGLYANPGVAAPRVDIPNQVTKEQKESYVHSTEVFLSGAKLKSGAAARYDVSLRIQPSPPIHLEDARELQKDASRSWSFKWTIVTTVDVVRGRNPKRQRVVNVRIE